MIPRCRCHQDIVRCVAAVIPLLLKYQGTGQVHGVIEEEDMTSQQFDLVVIWGEPPSVR